MLKSPASDPSYHNGVILIKYEHFLNSGAWEDPLPMSKVAKTKHLRHSTPVTPTTTDSNQKCPNNRLIQNNNHHILPALPFKLSRTQSSCELTIKSDKSALLDNSVVLRNKHDQALSEESGDESSNSLVAIRGPGSRKNQLRLSINRAKHHLSFDKWKSSTPPVQSPIHQTRNGTMPETESKQIHQQQPRRDSLSSPGESPVGRLSRWFSIRRGSSHQYDLRSKDDQDHVDNGHPVDGRCLPQTPLSVRKSKLSQLSEADEDCKKQHFVGSEPNDMIGSCNNGSILNIRGGIGLHRITPTLPPPPENLSPEQLKRRHIVAAIVHSENSYVATLHRLVNDYKGQLESCNPPILSSSKISTLFLRLPEIYQHHSLFRIALAEAAQNWDGSEALGDVFFATFSQLVVLDVYSEFINNFSAAMQLAKMEAKRKSALADFFKVKQISAHDRLSFFGLMVKPVQRFPQFILFLQDLLKHTPKGHHDRMSLQLALTQLESLAEMLNERKREAEQYQAFKEILCHISGTFNTRSIGLQTTDGKRNRYLLRQDNVTLFEINQSGFIVKSKQRRLLLLNDKVICVSVAPKQSDDFGATEKLTLKWVYPVADVEIVDTATSATLSRILTAGLNRGGSLKSNNSFDGSNNHTVMNGADNLCQEMSNLMHDFEVVSRINELVGSLKGNYDQISTDVTRKLLSTIQGSIQKKDEEMAWVDSCVLQIVAKNRNGKEDTYTFQTENPSIKQEWITELRLAQLALDVDNFPAWDVPEHEERPTTKMPLFVRAQSVCKSQHSIELRCGCYYTTTNHNRLSVYKRPRKHNYLWTCTSNGTSSHITILSQHQQRSSELKDVCSFDLLETQVTAIEFVKGIVSTDDDKMTTLCDTVWLGTDSRKLLIYAASSPEQERLVGQYPVIGTITHILYHLDSVFVSLTNGSILMYQRGNDNCFLTDDPRLVQLGVQEPITSLLPINVNVYVGCGRKVWILNGGTGDIERSYPIKHGSAQTIYNPVNLLAQSGVGLWVSLKDSSIICLYHMETFKHLQDINIASHVLRVTSSQRGTVNNNSSVHVTALMACKGLLWVGTNVGISLTIPLPRLEGVPIISGSVNISHHAHFGKITFLLPLIPKTYGTVTREKCKITPEQINDNKQELEIKRDQILEPTKNNETQVKAIDGTEKKQELDNSTESQKEIDSLELLSPKRLTQTKNSPIVIRRLRSKELVDLSRTSKTLPRGFGMASLTASNFANSSSVSPNVMNQGTCDVYNLYGGLIFVREGLEYERGQGTDMMEPTYENLRRSDPELAAIPAKVSTLDRRVRMKVARPRSLDLSNWSVDSRSSSFTSSGSEESMALRHGSGFFSNRSVSRNSSNASRKIGTDLVDICENGTPMQNQGVKPSTETYAESLATVAAAATLKRGKKTDKTAKQTDSNLSNRTLITLTGGRGYINWRNVWYNKTGSIQTNSNDAHIIIWEKKL